MKKLNKHLKRVLGLSFVLLACAPFTLISAQDKENDLTIQENAPERLKTPNRARVNNDTYQTFDIAYNTDYQNYYNTGVYEIVDQQGQFYTYVIRLSDFYAVVRDDGSSNTGNIYGIGFRCDYELYINDSNSFTNNGIEDYSNFEYYVGVEEGTFDAVPINKLYNTLNANFNINFYLNNEFLVWEWTLTTSQGLYAESQSSYQFMDFSEYIQFDYEETTFHNNLTIPVSNLYYSFNYGNNYQQGFDDGRNSILDNLEQSKTESYTQGYQKGFDTAKNMYEDLAENPMNWTMLAESIITLPSKIIKTGFDFDIFGVNVGDFIQTLIVIALVIFCIKTFTGNGGSN